jgi:hypothetical protein
MSERSDLFALLYQIAGDRLLADDLLTEGQKARLTELILNTLDQPDRYPVKVIRDLYKLAKTP